MCINWDAFGAIATAMGAVATFGAAGIALWASQKANKSSLEANKRALEANECNRNILKLQEMQYHFSTKPILECYLDTYKLESGKPYIVLVIENYGTLTARDIKVTVDYPSGIVDSEFAVDAQKLIDTPFTLAPHTKLSTPICWNADMEKIVNGKIKICGTFYYFDIDNCHRDDEIVQTLLSVDEFNLFNAINKVGGQQ